ncbi:SusC/RagA family TonB-linked outer membrane protein [Fodinibius salsisoli]|uniref:TonB-dependent receptor n=1 Tax=Fodinibius salsisoli TaxID=2820877 RepID=A0ABT3PKQ7_9BACT|nr:TonB-dependent receptor [Fodinibius salsisoli]MCW9706482.1 TonB-dependent receptor [Fodinibius salsisoli]
MILTDKKAGLLGVIVLLLMTMTLGRAMAQDQPNKSTLANVQEVPSISDEFYKAELDLKIDINFSEISIEQALRQIARKSGLKLSYRGDILQEGRVFLQKKNMPVTDALEYVLKDTPLDYKLSRKGYLVIHQKLQTAEEKIAVTISGVVTDAQSGETIPGVNILVKGTSIGASTNATGEFTLDAPALTDTLIVSFIGYQTQEVPIDGRTELEISLLPGTITGDELVVVGYGEQREISLIGSQSSLANEQVGELKQSSGSLTNSLAGRLSGVVGVQRSGLPGSDASDIWIRGISTFGDSSPLVMVDGVERPMNSLNPEDIQSLTILKDASATAVYGTRGANGVILIETKEGMDGKPSINVDYYQGVTELTRVPELADGPTYMRLANEANTTRGGNPIYTDEDIQNTIDGTNSLLYPNVDWMGTVFNDYGQNRQFNANVSGGSESTQYYLSLSYYDENGLLVNSDSSDYNTNSNYKKYNLQSNVTLDVTPTTKAKLGIGGYLEDRQYPAGDPDNPIDGVGRVFNQALEVSPVAYPIMYPGGLVPGRNPNGGERNPYADATNRGYTDQFNSQLFSNLELTQDLGTLIQGLSLKGVFGFDTNSLNRVIRGKRPNTYYINPSDPYDVDGSYYYNLTYEGNNTLGYDRRNSGGREYYLQGSLNYQNDFGSRHQVSGVLVYSQLDEQNAFAGDFTASIPHREQSLALRGTYSYDDRYFFEANFGYSGSENFARENRYGFFPSAGVGWVISNEEFFEPLSGAIDFFKIRYSDGFVGASGTDGRRFAYLTLLESYGNAYYYGLNRSGRNGINVSEYGVDVRWSESRKQDLGIEIRTLQDQLSLTVDFFKERREGIFLRRTSIPNFVGLTSDPYGNLGVIENKGFDGQLKFNGRLSQDFNLGIQAQFTYNKDTIVENDQPPQPYPWMDRRGNNLLAIYGYEAVGLFESQEEIDDHAQQFGQVLPGDIKYKDLNGDGVINAFDRKKIARGDVPYLTLGSGITLGYKAFDLQAFFQAQFGSEDQINGYGIHPFQGGGGRGNIYAIATDRWTEENPDPNAFYPRLAYGEAQNNNNFQTSSYWTRKFDFIRMKEVEFGYTLPVSMTTGTALKSARIYFRGRNLLTFSEFDLWDPELNTTNGSAYPNTKVYAIGLDIQF